MLGSIDDTPIIRPEFDPPAMTQAPPRVSRRMVAGSSATYRTKRRSLAIRHVSNDGLIALIQILSPANKDRASSLTDFVTKVHAALRHGCHVLAIDLFPPGRHDPHGIHGAIWESFDAVDYLRPADKRLMLAAYEAATLPEAYLEPIAVGDALADMPLFLDLDWNVKTPLESTSMSAFSRVPARWRDMLKEQENPPPG